MPLSPNMRGALFMAVAMAGFTMNDAITKGAVEVMNQGQVMLVRGLFATSLIALLAWSQGALRAPRLLAHPMVALRSTCELGATITFLVALAHMPLGNVSAVLQALPLAVTMAAAFFLGESVGWRRWIAVALGFLGVVVIVRPGFEGFNSYSLLALACVAFCAVRDVATKRLPHEIPTLLVSFATAGIVTVAGAALVVPMGGWSPMSFRETGLLFGAAVLLFVGYHFIILSMRTGDISFIAPFRYTALLWSILLGYLVFGEVPDSVMIIGASIVVASGLYALYRERLVGQKKPVASTTGPAIAPDGT